MTSSESEKITTDGIILDIDGTIWNTTPIVAEAWNKAIEKTGYSIQKVSAEILQKEFGKPMNIIAKDLWPDLTDSEAERIMDECCIQEHIALEANTRNITYENVTETIKELSKIKKVFIVSNCQDGYIELTIRKNCIENYITDFECYGHTKKYKAQNILLVKERNNLKNPVYVGDTQGDADACREAGIPFIFAEYGFGDTKDFARKISNLSELKNILV